MNNPYSTHLPVLKTLIEKINIDSIFEFGCGEYSTLYFAEVAKKVIAIEMQSEEWFCKIQKKIPDNVKLYYQPGPQMAIDTLKISNQYFDLIFVDGHGDSRWDCINNSFSKTNLIVTHDVETSSYKWGLVKIPEGWTYIQYKKLTPWTGIYFKNHLDVGELFNEN